MSDDAKKAFVVTTASFVSARNDFDVRPSGAGLTSDNHVDFQSDGAEE